MLHIGLDVHWKTTTVCILNANGKKVKTKKINGHWDKVMAFLKAEVAEPCQVVFEASCGYGVLYDQLMALRQVQRVYMAHPGQLRLIFRSKRKNDRVDAEKLAKLLYLDEVPTAYVPTLKMRQWRELIEARQHVVAKVVRTKNELRALLRMQGLVAPKGLWSRQGLAWLAAVEMPELRDLRRQILVAELAVQRDHLKKLTEVLDRIAGRSPGVALLRTIPGIGPRTAEAMAAYVGDPRRFGRVRAIGAYLGLIPSQDASAATNRLGRITREGPSTVRKLLVEASWQVIRWDPEIRKRFERLCHDRKDRRKKALVAVARHLACCMLSMLQTGEVWRGAA